MRISKIIVETFWKTEFLCILLFFDEMMGGFQNSLSKNFEKFDFCNYILLFCDEKCCEDFRIIDENLKKVYFLCILFVMKWCEDFKNHCRKIWKILNHLFYYFVMKWCEDFKNHCQKSLKNSNLICSIFVFCICICMYFITLLWNDVKISKIIDANFEQV